MSTMTLEYLDKTTGSRVYNKYPDISDRAQWDSLSDELKSALIRSGEEAQKEPWTELLISDFMEFSKSGNRVRFEDKYFPRRRKLNRLIMAECAENKGRFVEDILDGMYLILGETTWCLPPHTSYERDAKQENMPDVTRPIIDLFDAESAAVMAYAEYLLRPVFAQISPYISVYVNRVLEERVFEPYLNQHFWWMGNGKEPMCNWTPWITQNVLICALTRDEDYFSEEKRRVILEKAAASCDFFLDEYGDDGCCNEGAQYYTHAGLCLFGCYELMGYSTDGFCDIFKEKKIRNIANYIVKMYVGGGYYINFADCSALPGRRSAREFLFGKATGDEVLCSFVAADFRDENESQKLIEDEINLFYHVLQAFSYDEMKRYPVSRSHAEDSYFESTGLMIARDDRYVLAVKAGNNADSHNHNDVGSFTVYKDGKPFIIDLGVGTYAKKTFSDKRYEIWTMQSQYHNLPTFVDYQDALKTSAEKEQAWRFGREPANDVYDQNIVMQKDGARFAAKDVECSLDEYSLIERSIEEHSLEGHSVEDRNPEERICSISMDIAPAYGDERVKSYRRKAELIKGEGIRIADEFDCDIPAYLSLMTYEKPVVTVGEGNGESGSKSVDSIGCYASNNSDIMITVGTVGNIRLTGAKSAGIETYAITDERLGTAWKHEVYRIVVEASEGEELIINLR